MFNITFVHYKIHQVSAHTAEILSLMKELLFFSNKVCLATFNKQVYWTQTLPPIEVYKKLSFM